MKTILLVLAIALSTALTATAQSRSSRLRKNAPATQALVQQLPLRRVVLYSNGVAFFERRGTVSGNAEISLQFKQSQVDDVLKSMVVLDLGRGQIGTVSYNSSAPPSARLVDIPFAIEAGTENNMQGGLAGVLRQLQGAQVVVTTNSRSLTGSILTVEERKSQLDANKPAMTSHALIVTTENGEIASFDLSEVRSVRLVDKEARSDLNEFANASASARRRDAKTIVITSTGQGQREMVVSYTIAAPIWKTTYRVVLDSTGKPFFQGWAIVDNVGDEDWQDVSLSLFSGTPISFIHQLQQPLYRYRPVIPIPDDLNLDPQAYEPGMGGNTGGGDYREGGGGPGGGGTGGGRGGSIGAVNEMVTVTAGTAGPETTLSDSMTAEDSSIKTAATGNEVGDLFEYHVDHPVTVRRDRSALIPILQTRMEGQRVSIYRESEHKDRPMSGLLLKNTSRLTLEGGSLTVIDGDSYAGEALIERLKPGEERFISFAVDLATLVATQNKEAREPVFLVRVVNGVFQAHYYNSKKKTYLIANQSDKPRTVFVEHPIQREWRLADETPRPIERTASAYRFRVELGPHETKELVVAERQALMDNYQVSSLTPRDLELFLSRRYLDEISRAALEKIVDIKRQIAEVAASVEAVDREVAEIGADQARLRENITALRQNAEAKQLIARYVAKANEQETRIEQLTSERKSKTAVGSRLQLELETAIRELALDRRLVADKQ
jgi:hypothetical protein